MKQLFKQPVLYLALLGIGSKARCVSTREVSPSGEVKSQKSGMLNNHLRQTHNLKHVQQLTAITSLNLSSG
ncbi:hypothetical protein [Nostoc flagelliforme]|uniref:hypothetical protein n=1 Tax=Nostoc flagelliforme TaxID=1306274 RepID=UPI000C2D6681|nr:hypothetical protein [Nostoc flagelliforme]